jgi:cytochrome c5
MRRALARKRFIPAESAEPRASAVICLIVSLALVIICVLSGFVPMRAEGASPVPVTSPQKARDSAQTPITGPVHPESSTTVLVPAATPTMAGMEERRRVLLPPLPASATQADRGAQVYMLVCSACHGSEGQGLTDAWRATWAPKDQNCWQTKCHAASHPPDGFELPRYVPPVVGPMMSAHFRTALDLHDYIRTAMPWHDPGSLLDDQYWDITAFVIRLMGVDPGRMTLDPQSAAHLELPRVQGEAGVVTPLASPTAVPSDSPPPHAPTRPALVEGTAPLAAAGGLPPVRLLVLVFAVATIAVGALLVVRSRRRS